MTSLFLVCCEKPVSVLFQTHKPTQMLDGFRPGQDALPKTKSVGELRCYHLRRTQENGVHMVKCQPE